MSIYIVTEGPFDTRFVERVLPEDLRPEVTVVNAGGSVAVESLARSLVVRRRQPVLILIDADTTFDALIAERRQVLEESLSSVSADAPTAVVLAIPELEIVFSEQPETLERTLGQVASTRMRSARSRPKDELTTIVRESKGWTMLELLENLNSKELAKLRKTRVVTELLEFVKQQAASLALAMLAS